MISKASLQASTSGLVLGENVSHAMFRRDREASLGWWRMRELVWPVAATSLWEGPEMGSAPRLYGPDALREKVCGPPAYGFTYFQHHSEPRFGWLPRTPSRGGPDTLTLTFGEAIMARGLHLYLPAGNGAGLGGILEVTLIGPGGAETPVLKQADGMAYRDGGGPALHVFSFEAPHLVTAARIVAASYNRHGPGTRAGGMNYTVSGVIDTVALVAVTPPAGTPEAVDYRPKSRPETSWFWKFLAIAGAIGLVGGVVDSCLRG